MKTKLLITFAVALLVSMVATISGIVVFNSPKTVTAKAIADVVEDVLAREELEPIYKTLTGGSVQFSLDSAKLENGENSFENSVAIAGKTYFNKKAFMLSNFEYKVSDDIFSGNAYISNEEIYFEENKILKDVYGGEFATLADDLANSIFAPNSSSKFSFDEQDYELLSNALKCYSNGKKLEQDIRKLTKRLIKDIYKIVMNNAETSSKNTNVRLNGTGENVRVISIVLTPEALANTYMDIYDYLLKDKSIIKFLDKYEDLFLLYLHGEDFPAEEIDSLSKYYKQSLEESSETIREKCDHIEAFAKKITVSIVTPKHRSKLLKFEFKQGQEEIFSVDLSKKGLKETDSITVKINSVELKYSVDANTKEVFEATLTVNSSYTKKHYNLSIDKGKGSYLFTTKYKLFNLYDHYFVRGGWETKDDTTTITVDKLTYKWGYTNKDITYEEGEDVVKCSFKLIIDTKDKMPSPIKSYLKISDITETNVNNWLEKLENYYE